MDMDTPYAVVRRRRARLLLVLLSLLGCATRDADPGATTGDEPDEPEVMIDEGSGLPEIAAPSMNVAANDTRVRSPLDATPSPDGSRVYFTALDRDSGEDRPGVFAIDADGEGEIAPLAVGGLLTAPVGISVSLDGERLFVADAATSDEQGRLGAILVVSTEGGEPTALPGTQGYAPRGVVIARVDDAEQLYFTGTDPESGRGGAFRIAPAGGEPERLGESLVDPAGIAVTEEGDAYVVDALGASGLASVVRIRDGESTTVASDLGVGFPAGIAVTTDGSAVLVSGLNPRTKRDLVYVMNAESLELSVVSKPVAGFAEPAGLHRAHDGNTFAWADSEANASGTVYVLQL